MQGQSKRGHSSQYLIQEPTTGLYAKFEADGTRLDYKSNASRFTTPEAAIAALGRAGLQDQPHELVRVDE